MDYADVSVTYLHEKGLAVLVEYDGNEHWIPISQINDWEPETHERDDCIDLEVTEWFAEKEGLI